MEKLQVIFQKRKRTITTATTIRAEEEGTQEKGGRKKGRWWWQCDHKVSQVILMEQMVIAKTQLPQVMVSVGSCTRRQWYGGDKRETRCDSGKADGDIEVALLSRLLLERFCVPLLIPFGSGVIQHS